jgi:hypothetical protein
MAVDTGDHAFPNRTVGAKPVQQDEEWVAAAALSEPDPTFSGLRRCHIPTSASQPDPMPSRISSIHKAQTGLEAQRGNDQKRYIRPDRSYPSYGRRSTKMCAPNAEVRGVGWEGDKNKRECADSGFANSQIRSTAHDRYSVVSLTKG